jgi:hypothetical protein
VRRRCFPRKGRAQRSQGAAWRVGPRLRRVQESWGQCASRLVLARSGRSRSSQSSRQRASQRAASTPPPCATSPRAPPPRAPPPHAPPHSAPFFPASRSLRSPGRQRPRDGLRAGRGCRFVRAQYFWMRTWHTSRAARPRSDTSLGGCFSIRSSRTQGARNRRLRDRRANGHLRRYVRVSFVPSFFAGCETERAQALHCCAAASVLASLVVPACTTAGIFVTLADCCCVAHRRFSPHHRWSLPNSRTPTRVHPTCSIARSKFGWLCRRSSAHLRRRTRPTRSAFVW